MKNLVAIFLLSIADGASAGKVQPCPLLQNPAAKNLQAGFEDVPKEVVDVRGADMR